MDLETATTQRLGKESILLSSRASGRLGDKGDHPYPQESIDIIQYDHPRDNQWIIQTYQTMVQPNGAGRLGADIALTAVLAMTRENVYDVLGHRDKDLHLALIEISSRGTREVTSNSLLSCFRDTVLYCTNLADSLSICWPPDCYDCIVTRLHRRNQCLNACFSTCALSSNSPFVTSGQCLCYYAMRAATVVVLLLYQFSRRRVQRCLGTGASRSSSIGG